MINADTLISENNKNFVLLLDKNKINTFSFKKVAVTVDEKSEKQ